MGWGETEAIIGKAPGLGIHTHVKQTPPRVSAQTLMGIFREHNFINFADRPCGGCKCVAEGGCIQGCCVGGRIGVRSRRCMEEVTVSNGLVSNKATNGSIGHLHGLLGMVQAHGAVLVE